MKRILFLLLLFASRVLISAQDTIHYDTNHKVIEYASPATSYEVIKYHDAKKKQATVYNYQLTGELKSEKNYSNYRQQTLNGKSKEFYDNGNLKEEIDIVKGKVDGYLITYWKNGSLKRKDYFKKDQFVDGQCFDQQGNEIKHFPFIQHPEFIGGLEVLQRYLRSEIRYPARLAEDKVQGRVMISFTIDKHGYVENIDVTKSSGHKEFDQEAMRVVRSMPPWKSGFRDGEPVKVYYKLPIYFNI